MIIRHVFLILQIDTSYMLYECSGHFEGSSNYCNRFCVGLFRLKDNYNEHVISWKNRVHVKKGRSIETF